MPRDDLIVPWHGEPDMADELLALPAASRARKAGRTYIPLVLARPLPGTPGRRPRSSASGSSRGVTRVELLPGADALSVHCPRCAAPAGEGCFFSNRLGFKQPCAPHAARVKLANDRREGDAPNHLRFAARLGAQMRVAGLSDRELARRVGVLPVLVVRWRKGQRRPSAANLARLARVLRCDREWLADGERVAA